MPTLNLSRRLWISLGVIGASIAIAVFAIVYFAGDITLKGNAVVAARANVDDQIQDVANLANLEQDAKKAQGYEAAIEALLPDQYGLVNFGPWFTSTGEQYGVTANATLQGTATPSQGPVPGNIAFTFTAQGAPSSIEAFLDAVSEKAPGFVVAITTFDVTGDGSGYQVSGDGTVFSR
jgi:hypothetical protein